MTLTYWNGTILGPYGVKYYLSFRQLMRTVFTVFQLSADQTILKRLHNWDSIPRLTYQVSTKLVERSRTVQCSRIGNHNTQLRQFCKNSKKKWLQTKSYHNPQKEPHIDLTYLSIKAHVLTKQNPDRIHICYLLFI